MALESFAGWRIPKEVDGIVLSEDLTRGRGRIGIDQRHRHDELEIHLVTRGKGTFLLGEELVEAGTGTLLWVRPGSDHTVVEASREFQRWMVLFRPRVVRRVLPPPDARSLLDRVRTDPARPLRRSIALPRARDLERLFGGMQSQMRGGVSLYNASIGYALAQSWIAFSETQTLPASSTLHPAVVEAARCLRETAPQASRSELARRCRLSEWHLSKLFREQMGASLVDFRNRCRLDRFFELYGDGARRKIMHAALEAGFGSYPQFHRVFCAQMGVTPALHYARAKTVG